MGYRTMGCCTYMVYRTMACFLLRTCYIRVYFSWLVTRLYHYCCYNHILHATVRIWSPLLVPSVHNRLMLYQPIIKLAGKKTMPSHASSVLLNKAKYMNPTLMKMFCLFCHQSASNGQFVILHLHGVFANPSENRVIMIERAKSSPVMLVAYKSDVC